ncbi:hypothetical protein [Peribacillus frigoritolerans]|uniref:Uncharacterized protein n=1 Tax=Peribacillus castrilensis TaxID=2897690 RepID=A0AAW9N349_9BACI|nr:hypothetical protein [Peribacillus castrilensis]
MKKFANLLPNYLLAETPQAFMPRRLGRQPAERKRISEIHWSLFQKKLQANSLFLESQRTPNERNLIVDKMGSYPILEQD